MEDIIKAQKESLELGGDIIGYEGDLRSIKALRAWHISSIKQLLESEIKRKEGMIWKEHTHEQCEDYLRCQMITRHERSYNQAIQEDISYLREQITKLDKE